MARVRLPVHPVQQAATAARVSPPAPNALRELLLLTRAPPNAARVPCITRVPPLTLPRSAAMITLALTICKPTRSMRTMCEPLFAAKALRCTLTLPHTPCRFTLLWEMVLASLGLPLITIRSFSSIQYMRRLRARRHRIQLNVCPASQGLLGKKILVVESKWLMWNTTRPTTTISMSV